MSRPTGQNKEKRHESRMFHRLDGLVRRVRGLDEELMNLSVVLAEKKHRPRPQAIPPGAPNLLVIRLEWI